MSTSRPLDNAELVSELQRGLAFHQSGQFDAAAAVYAGILRSVPEQPETLDLYGVLLHQTGNDGPALDLLNRAVALSPNSAGFRNHLGAVQRALGHLEAAVESFGAARRLEPDQPEAALNLAVGLGQIGRHDEAERAARDAVRLWPDNPDCRLVLAESLRRIGRDEDAVGELRNAVSALGPSKGIQIQLVRALLKLGRGGDAAREAKLAIAIDPAEPEGYMTLATTEAGSLAARWAVVMAPDDARAWSSFASMLSQTFQNADATGAAKRAVLLRPDSSTGYLNLTTCANRLYLYRTSLDAANRGLLIDHASHHLAVSAAFNEFLIGDVARGWTLYRRRGLLAEELPRIGLPPEWDVSEAPAGTVLVCAEQGLGDEYMFMSCLADLLATTRDVVVECEARNLGLFGRSFPGVRFFARAVAERPGGDFAWDYHAAVEIYRPSRHILAATLMERCGVGMGRPPLEGGYLLADPDERAAWAEWSRSIGDGPSVGLCWRSGDADEIRSEFYFSLADVIDALGASEADFVSLIYVDPTEELADLAASHGVTVHDPPGIDQRDELDRLAALISSLDMVVSVDNSVAAMAASCGVPTILLQSGLFQITGDGDALFANVHPCMAGPDPFDRDHVLAAAGVKIREFLALAS